jgi:two-component system cell cycle sensor histidine kinase/response regulator CckA
MTKAGILIVEDENIIALDIKRSLLNLGYDVVGTAASGEDAIIKAERSQPDLVLMDIMLKGEMDGIEAAEQMRMRFDIPLVFLTAYANDTVLERAKIIQPFGYILKPFRENELHTNIEIALYRHEMEKQLREREAEIWRATKLEAIGILAGGIAHDFNNILTVILGNISLAMLDTEASPAHERLIDAERACLHAQTLSRQLLTFSRGGAPIKELISVAKLVNETCSFASRGSNVRCELNLSDKLWPVNADPGLLGQVFQNLVINAIQAMPTGGIIEMRGENLVVEAKNSLPLDTGKYVKISVQDHGTGIPEEYLPRIFDPYFTTKQTGSGLGMATAYSIIKHHKGHIGVESKLGEGSIFQVYLPAGDQEIIEPPIDERTVLKGHGKILVMDDEEMVRELLDNMLGHLGYKVIFAKHGFEALDLFSLAQDSGEGFDALILDLTIPGGMGGKATLEKLLKIDPQIKAIASSGYSEDPIMAEFARYGFSGVIAKPYEISKLSKVLHEIIGKGKKEVPIHGRK